MGGGGEGSQRTGVMVRPPRMGSALCGAGPGEERRVSAAAAPPTAHLRQRSGRYARHVSRHVHVKRERLVVCGVEEEDPVAERAGAVLLVWPRHREAVAPRRRKDGQHRGALHVTGVAEVEHPRSRARSTSAPTGGKAW